MNEQSEWKGGVKMQIVKEKIEFEKFLEQRLYMRIFKC